MVDMGFIFFLQTLKCYKKQMTMQKLPKYQRKSLHGCGMNFLFKIALVIIIIL